MITFTLEFKIIYALFQELSIIVAKIGILIDIYTKNVQTEIKNHIHVKVMSIYNRVRMQMCTKRHDTSNVKRVYLIIINIPALNIPQVMKKLITVCLTIKLATFFSSSLLIPSFGGKRIIFVTWSWGRKREVMQASLWCLQCGIFGGSANPIHGHSKSTASYFPYSTVTEPIPYFISKIKNTLNWAPLCDFQPLVKGRRIGRPALYWRHA